MDLEKRDPLDERVKDVPPLENHEWDRWRGASNERVATLQAAVVASCMESRESFIEVRADVKALRRTMWQACILGGAMGGFLAGMLVYRWFGGGP